MADSKKGAISGKVLREELGINLKQTQVTTQDTV